MEPCRQIIFAWSLNPDCIIQAEEKGTASLEERLSAAAQAQQKGHPVAFHFDPLLRFDGWEDAYRGVVERLGKSVDLSRTFWVSLGAFRFPPQLKPIIESRFPENRLLYEEFIIGEDGKMRYFKPLRLEMFLKMVEWLKEESPEIFIYLCMEREDIWEAVLSYHPESNLHLKKMLDERCRSVLLLK
jgi:spore photoproduct lyase